MAAVDGGDRAACVKLIGAILFFGSAFGLKMPSPWITRLPARTVISWLAARIAAAEAPPSAAIVASAIIAFPGL